MNRIKFEVGFNINDRVKVKLTELGQVVLNNSVTEAVKNISELTNYSPYKPDKDGYIEIQLWQFMNIFGEHFWNGAPQIIERNEIIFITEVRSERF